MKLKKRPFINNKLHLAVQEKICTLIGADDLSLERHFKSHIADIYWESKNIVFEVQCSPISLKETKKRTEDYKDLGVRLIWILHQKTFHKDQISPAEEYLIKKKQVLYTNITQHGEGFVYTFKQIIEEDRRVANSLPLKVDLSLLPSIVPETKKIPIEIYTLKGKYLLRSIKRHLLYYRAYVRWKLSL